MDLLLCLISCKCLVLRCGGSELLRSDLVGHGAGPLRGKKKKNTIMGRLGGSE